MAAFEVYAFNAAGRVRGIERHKIEPVFAVHIVDAFDGHFVIAIADDSDLAAVVSGVLLEHQHDITITEISGYILPPRTCIAQKSSGLRPLR